jgi:hypothetical protein
MRCEYFKLVAELEAKVEAKKKKFKYCDLVLIKPI